MRQLAAVAASLTVSLLLVAVAHAGLTVGVNDDAAVESSTSPWFFATMQSEGLTVDTVTLRWDEGLPTSIQAAEVTAIDAVITAAAKAGVTVELDLYPLHSAALTDGYQCHSAATPLQCGDSVRIQRFAAWTAQVAQTFPSVHEFVVMNECNQPYFVNPQWTSGGTNQSAEICGRALAAAYDALHAVDADNLVWGLGLSPRGNDDPNAATNSSTSPVKFLTALGSWFRAFAAQTHRMAPLMDGLDVHPYPVPQSLPFAEGYANPNDASVANLPRLYQAFYSAFTGTAQPTIGQQPGGGLPVSVNEVGIQTSSAGLTGYTGLKAAANAAGGVFGPYATQTYQASWYRQMLDLLACDPNVKVVNIFKLVDEPSLGGWQSGLYEFSSSGTPIPKQSAQAVAAWIAATHGNCQGTPRPWQPPTPPTPTPTPAPSRPVPTVPLPLLSDPYRHGARGYDLSFPNCKTTVPRTGFLIVGLNGGQPFTANPCFRLQSARTRGRNGPVSVYLNSGYSRGLLRHNSAVCRRLGAAEDVTVALQRAYSLGCTEAASAYRLLHGYELPTLYWLDVERSNPWSSDTTLNAATLQGMVDFLSSLKPKPLVGIYSFRAWWREIAGGWPALNLPEWTPIGNGAGRCAQPFAQGPVWLRQGGSARLDVDFAC